MLMSFHKIIIMIKELEGRHYPGFLPAQDQTFLDMLFIQ